MVSPRWLLASALILVGCGEARSQRLPEGVRPEHYAITITPDLKAAKFAGTETIEVVLTRPVDAITLNAAEIEFGIVKARAGDSNAVSQMATVSLDAKTEQAALTFEHPLPAGPVTLEIAYSGIMNDKLRGFYLSKTKARSYGVTQFEATDARRAFPSFDEPALKATFDITLVVDNGDTAISNMQIVSDKLAPAPGKHTITFATTPKMSTYLVAWLVGDFQCSKGKSDGIPIRACATPDKVALTRFALDAAKWELKYYDKYFAIKYPLKKLDMVAIPDFEAGAMENFGCITYRETEMLVDSKNGSLDAKKEVASTVAHEMSHQWFGDLVTPAWWDNLWLNEGFATWMETKAAGAWKPKWNYPEEVAIEKNHTMDSDAGKTTRAILTKAETPSEINELFDDIAYGKAGAVIGMVENWVGEDVFRSGVQQYLAAHLYGNARAEDFWDTQARVSGLPVDQVMRSFVEQPGVPLVTLGGSASSVSQRRFYLSGALPVSSEAWNIPVCFAGGACRLLANDAKTMDAPVGVYANAQDKGYYRTAYPPAGLKAIEASAETALNVPERIGLLGDRWATMRGGLGSVADFMDLVLAVKQDASPTVMEMALGKVDTIESKIASDQDRERMDAVVRREFAPRYEALGMPKHESVEHAELRGMLFEELGEAKDPAVIAEAELVSSQLLAGKKPADPRIADAAVALATEKGDQSMYDRLLKVAQETSDPDLKVAALEALTRFENPALVKRTLEYAVSNSVRNQESWELISLLLEHRPTQNDAWTFVEEHWPEIEHKLTVGSGARIVDAAGSFCSVEKRDAVSSFFKSHPVVSSQRTLAKTLESISDCIEIRSKQEPELRRWLDAQH